MRLLFILILAMTSFKLMADGKVVINVGLTPAGSFQGTSEKVKGNLFKQGENFTADKISVSIESFKTGIDLRDQHMWKHLNSEKNPKATLSDLKVTGGKATANLEVNGVTRPVEISYTVAGTDVKANFSVKASDFNLPKKEYLGVGVNDTVTVDATFPFRVKK